MSQEEALGLKGQTVRYGDGCYLASFGTPLVIASNQHDVGQMCVRLETVYGGEHLVIVVQAGWVKKT